MRDDPNPVPAPVRVDTQFVLLFTVMLTIAAGNTALQSVLPALGRSLGVRDNAVAAAFSVSALLWVIAGALVAGRLSHAAGMLSGRMPLLGAGMLLTFVSLLLAAGTVLSQLA